jgi:hypothetical protein
MSSYFIVGESNSKDRFVVRLEDPAKIAHARKIIDGTERARVHIQGRIISTSAPYNPAWRFHLDPASIDFFSIAIEVCDAAIRYVNEHLEDVGTDFLPNAHWCPWGSRIVAEVTAEEGGQ